MVILICTTIVLLLALVCAVAFRKKLRMSILQSTILGLTISVPILYMFMLDILGWIGKQMFKVASLLAGIEFEELLTKMFVFQVQQGLGKQVKARGASVDEKVKNQGSEKEGQNDTQNEGDR